jgi:glycosyltransferase involved in cell wall biosynthesis
MLDPETGDVGRIAAPHSTLVVSLVVPVYNEAETVGLFMERVSQVFDRLDKVRIEVLFVNDGSSDGTLERLLDCQQRDPRVRVVDLSRNFGKEAALSSGIQAARGQVVVPIDVDLQDPPEIILDMIARWREGFEVVLGRRINRDSDSWAKRVSATWFYRIHNWISEPVIPENVGDFRLMDRMVVDALKELPESRRFMKGLFAWVGFRTAVVDYVRSERAAGSSKFDGWRLWNFALEGLTSFSTVPLRIWAYLGGIVALLSFLYGLVITARVLILGVETPGYASMFVAVTFLGGLQLIGIGVIGEYLGRTYLETKRRPVFLVRHIYEPRD